MDTQRFSGGVALSARNLESYEVTITLTAQLENMRPDRTLPLTLTLSGRGSRVLVTLRAASARRPWRYEYRYYWTYGTTDASHDDAHVYSLPYAPGRAFRVIQGFGGSFSHTGDCAYAIDWGMPEGTAVRAARAGLIVGARDRFTRGGPDRAYKDFANFVIVKHADGTFGEYDHFRPGGVVVNEGERVEAGDLLGYSGNTGFSSGPHLHLCVYKAVDGYRRESFPIRFRTEASPAQVLEEGRSYAAVAP